MKLYYTPLSHFSRKVRILIEAFQLDCEYIDVGNVAATDPKAFGDNPLMAVPVLVDQDQWIIDSNYIAEYLVRNYNTSDDFKVLTTNVHDLNIRAVIDGVMSNEVKLVIAKRTGVPIEDFAFFEKSRLAIRNGLNWLENHADSFSVTNLGYKEIHLICSLQHLENYKFIEYKDFPKLANILNAWAGDKRISTNDPKIYEVFKK